MTDFASIKHVKHTRKPHTCLFCGRVIDVGESAKSVFCKRYGDHSGYYLCDWCGANMSTILDGESEFSPGDFYSYVYDALCPMLPCPVCGDADCVEFDCDTKTEKVNLKCDDCKSEWALDLNQVLGLEV